PAAALRARDKFAVRAPQHHTHEPPRMAVQCPGVIVPQELVQVDVQPRASRQQIPPQQVRVVPAADREMRTAGDETGDPVPELPERVAGAGERHAEALSRRKSSAHSPASRNGPSVTPTAHIIVTAEIATIAASGSR